MGDSAGPCCSPTLSASGGHRSPNDFQEQCFIFLPKRLPSPGDGVAMRLTSTSLALNWLRSRSYRRCCCWRASASSDRKDTGERDTERDPRGQAYLPRKRIEIRRLSTHSRRGPRGRCRRGALIRQPLVHRAWSETEPAGWRHTATRPGYNRLSPVLQRLQGNWTTNPEQRHDLRSAPYQATRVVRQLEGFRFISHLAQFG